MTGKPYNSDGFDAVIYGDGSLWLEPARQRYAEDPDGQMIEFDALERLYLAAKARREGGDAT